MQSISYYQKIVNFIENINETHTILSRLDIEKNKNNEFSYNFLKIFSQISNITKSLGSKSHSFHTNFVIKIINDFFVNKSKNLKDNSSELINIELNFDGETLKLIDDIINCFNYETSFEIQNINYKFLNDVNNYQLYVFYLYLELSLLKILIFTKHKCDNEMNQKLFDIFYMNVIDPKVSISGFDIKNLCNDNKIELFKLVLESIPKYKKESYYSISVIKSLDDLIIKNTKESELSSVNLPERQVSTVGRKPKKVKFHNVSFKNTDNLNEEEYQKYTNNYKYTLDFLKKYRVDGLKDLCYENHIPIPRKIYRSQLEEILVRIKE